jgi:hypothetical protein
MLKKEFPYYPESLKQNMALLLLWDFFARYWWIVIYFIYLMFSSWVVFDKHRIDSTYIVVMSFAWGAAGLMSWERRRGAVTVYETLPIPHGMLARILWLEGVLVFPLIFLLCSPLAIMFTSLFGNDTSSITLHDMLMHISLVIVMGAGYASTLLQTKEQQFTWKVGIQILFMIGAVFFAKYHLIKIEQYELWGIMLLMAYPVIILMSYFLSNRLLPSYVVSRKPTRKTAPRFPRSQTFFWFQFGARQLGMIVLGFLACVALSFMFALVRERENIVIVDPFIFIFILGVMPSALSLSYVSEMRPFRALPMTAGRLSIFLFSIPIINTLCAALLVTIVYLAMGMYDSLWHILAAVCFSLGFSSILYNVLVLFGQMALGLVPFIFWFSFMFWAVEILYIVPVVGLATSPLLMYVIKYSSEVYHRRTSLARGGAFFGRR